MERSLTVYAGGAESKNKIYAKVYGFVEIWHAFQSQTMNNRAIACSDWWNWMWKKVDGRIIAISLQSVATIVQLIFSFRWNGVWHARVARNLHWIVDPLVPWKIDKLNGCSWKYFSVDSLDRAQVGITHRWTLAQNVTLRIIKCEQRHSRCRLLCAQVPKLNDSNLSKNDLE